MKTLYYHMEVIEMFSKFPRQISLPWRFIVETKKDFLYFVNKYNSIKDIYISLYNYEKNTGFNNCHIDKIAFDIDNDNSLDTVKKLQFYCKLYNFQHSIMFSGNGFWFFVYTKNYEKLTNRKQALKNAQLSILKNASIKLSDIDQHCIGDIARVCRVPSTINLKSIHKKRVAFARFLKENEITNLNDIKKLSQKQDNEYYYKPDNFKFNELKIDLKTYDCEITTQFEPIKIITNNESVKEDLPECIKTILSQNYVHWRERFFVLTFLMNNGYSQNDAVNIMKKYLLGKKHPKKSQDNFYSMYKIERQHEYIYNKPDLFFSCKEVKEYGFCNKRTCEHIDKLYV